MRLTGCSSIYRHFGLFTDSLVKTCLSVVFSAREIAKRDAEKDELMTALSRLSLIHPNTHSAES